MLCGGDRRAVKNAAVNRIIFKYFIINIFIYLPYHTLKNALKQQSPVISDGALSYPAFKNQATFKFLFINSLLSRHPTDYSQKML